MRMGSSLVGCRKNDSYGKCAKLGAKFLIQIK